MERQKGGHRFAESSLGLQTREMIGKPMYVDMPNNYKQFLRRFENIVIMYLHHVTNVRSCPNLFCGATPSYSNCNQFILLFLPLETKILNLQNTAVLRYYSDRLGREPIGGFRVDFK